MKKLIKPAFPSLACLLLGMSMFPILSSIAFPLGFSNKLSFGIVACTILLLLSGAFLRYEKIAISAVHLMPNKYSLQKLSVGLIVGALITGAMLFALFTLTSFEIQRIEEATIVSFLLASIAIIPLALMEEILFRGYPFVQLSKVINIRWVILITSVLFALYHYNGNQSIIDLMLGPGIWGVTFGVAAYLSNSLAMPLGMHISANLFQAMFGLKADYVSMWTIANTIESSGFLLDEKFLGIAMQLCLLVITILTFELLMKQTRWRGGKRKTICK